MAAALFFGEGAVVGTFGVDHGLFGGRQRAPIVAIAIVALLLTVEIGGRRIICPAALAVPHYVRMIGLGHFRLLY